MPLYNEFSMKTSNNNVGKSFVLNQKMKRQKFNQT